MATEPAHQRKSRTERDALRSAPAGADVPGSAFTASQTIGFHVSIAGGLWKAIGRALERGCTALQIFCGSPRSWKWRTRAAEQIERFKADRSAAGLTPLVVHSCYLVNPCSSRGTVLRRSISRLSAELDLAAALGADYYVLHPGSHKGRSAEWGTGRAAESISAALRRASRAPMLLLENTAAPHGPGGDFTALGVLLRRVKEAARSAETGIAVDSCHAFGAGYDLRRPGEVRRLIADLDRTVGLERLRLLHVNDSRDAPGSGRDRHQHIGRGTIGETGLRNLLTHPALVGLPLILETPWETVDVDRQNLKAVLNLLGCR